MFGYVVINKKELKFREYDEYRGFYCGLCKSLSERYGISGQITLNYDMTFLAMLLTALYEEDIKAINERCIIHPFKKQLKYQNKYIDYAADMTIILSYFKCKDDVDDEGKISARAEKAFLEKKMAKIKEIYPDKCLKIEQELNLSAELEKMNTDDLDAIAGASGHMLGTIFSYKDDEWSKALYETGFYLGKYIYLADAYEDIEKDIRKNNFNLFKNKVNDNDFESYIEDILSMMISSCASAFETLPIFEYREILRNILYSGIWTRYEIIKKRKEKKKDE